MLLLGMLTACATTPRETAPALEHKSSADVFRSSAVGFSIAKPSDWHFISDDILREDRNTLRLDDDELDRMAREYANIPLVVFTRHPEPYPTLNPSVSVTMAFMPMEGLTPGAALAMSTEISKQAYPDLVVVEPVREYTLDGLQGAYTKTRYTAAFADGQRFPTEVRMWIVPRGKIMFIVGMAGPQEGPDIFKDIHQEILNSIQIEK